jgi:hypothetical protein
VKPIPITPKTLAVARNIIWFESPEKALADPVRLVAYAMTYALPEDMRLIRQYVSDDDFREALDHAPAGIIDPRSWAYWNSKMGRYPPPPLPVRQLGIAPGSADSVLTPEGRHSGADSTSNSVLEEQRRYGRMAWLRMRQQESSNLDPEEARRRAREEWRAKYVPKDST